ncbi:MAG: hypothetical protein HY319_04720 [Armatimonadetes bacterium]|nr:hypothetical protein [Armatimonadota bacterium]
MSELKDGGISQEELLVRCPRDHATAKVFLERTPTLEGEVLEFFRCDLQDGSQQCTRSCLKGNEVRPRWRRHRSASPLE